MYAAGYGPATMNISLRTSIIFISWSPPEFHLPVVHYIATLSRVTGQELCPEFVDNRTRVLTGATSTSFTDLEEFSAYTVTVTTTFDVFGSNVDEVTPQMMFTTLSAGKCSARFRLFSILSNYEYLEYFPPYAPYNLAQYSKLSIADM